MKRFYCTICKKVKRVRNLPITTRNVASDNPEKRIGQCEFHSTGFTYGQTKRMINVPIKKVVNGR